MEQLSLGRNSILFVSIFRVDGINIHLCIILWFNYFQKHQPMQIILTSNEIKIRKIYWLQTTFQHTYIDVDFFNKFLANNINIHGIARRRCIAESGSHVVNCIIAWTVSEWTRSEVKGDGQWPFQMSKREREDTDEFKMKRKRKGKNKDEQLALARGKRKRVIKVIYICSTYIYIDLPGWSMTYLRMCCQISAFRIILITANKFIAELQFLKYMYVYNRSKISYYL